MHAVSISSLSSAIGTSTLTVVWLDIMRIVGSLIARLHPSTVEKNTARVVGVIVEIALRPQGGPQHIELLKLVL